MLTDIDLPALEYIAFNLRAEDREEIFALLDHDNPVQFAWQAFWLFRNQGRARVAWHDGRPAAVIGLSENYPTVWQISMYGTPDFRAVVFECMRWARRNIAELMQPPFHGRRLQCDSRVGHAEAQRFLLALGARPEGPPMRYYGKDGSDYVRYVWLKSENDEALGKWREMRGD